MRPMDLVYVDIAGPYLLSLGGLRYVIMFVDGASCLQKPYEAREKNAPAILAMAKSFGVDMS